MRIARIFRTLCAVLVLLAWQPGCDGKLPFDTAKVTGVVTYQGKPLDHGQVIFVPEFNDFKVWALGNGTTQRSNSPINYTARLFDPANPHDIAFNGCPCGSFNSRHEGGVHFVFADGHVTFLSDLIDMPTYYAITTRDMSESVRENSQ